MNASTEPKDTGVPSPGPWTYTRHERPASDYAEARTVHTIEDASGVRIAIGVRDEANARLMAASPDLLETAEAFLAWFRENAGHFTIGGDDELKRGFEDRARALATACHDATEGRQP